MSSRAFFVGPWDLDRNLACLPRRPEDGPIVFVESRSKLRALPYHRKKLVLELSAQQHFLDALEGDGFDVTRVEADTYVEGLKHFLARRKVDELVALAPREHGLHRSLLAARDALGAELSLHDDGGEGGHFLFTRDELADWAKGRKTLRMDAFYRFGRQRTGWLMAGREPVGGRWSFDSENRKPAKGLKPPPVPSFEPDSVTRAIMKRVAATPDLWGEVEGFDWPVTREEALRELERFFGERAAGFGPYQDAMLAGERFLWHSRLSVPLNLGLLHPREVCERAVAAYEAGTMPIESAEGFVRQILGWREYVRGAYWLRMPAMREANLLGAHRPLPRFYWEPARTRMRCVRESAGQVRETGYAHHIQRLMVLGNFALLADVEPLALSHWFWAGFVDAYEWVELPNVHGMALYADPGITTKPYAASGSYVAKMSDYCKGCHYDVKARTGEQSCPFNSLFWRFMVTHSERLTKNPRLGALMKTWERFGSDEQRAILETARLHLEALEPENHGWAFADDAG